MNLKEKSLAVSELYKELDAEMQAFIGQSGLGCLPGCGFCCSKPTVQASILEFLPFAFHIVEQGKGEEALLRLEEAGSTKPCILYKSFSEDGESGFCSAYAQRGLICRVFGASARKNKQGQREIITCKKIKTQKADAFQVAQQAVQEGSLEVSSSSGAYSYLYGIDFELAAKTFPVNEALRLAVEHVLTYRYYSGSEEAAPESSF
ncbi:fe-s-cluster oxidoreductase [Nitritalea halalkaliphila LW7]|uniref:Fe-s-cluster oxidoreductase n=1 Tax=Nitritalea halalkaliphila LW7 TaxID=1189621 RepID=I5C5P7_9BACT|nr:YkgJ family cysteine cluster protein [Nitritalea halalkaliphila]EIM77149.1 fe-s-cluster oxidoreductase [Nitritalea halalkaliphila LW7]